MTTVDIFEFLESKLESFVESNELPADFDFVVFEERNLTPDKDTGIHCSPKEFTVACKGKLSDLKSAPSLPALAFLYRWLEFKLSPDASLYSDDFSWFFDNFLDKHCSRLNDNCWPTEGGDVFHCDAVDEMVEDTGIRLGFPEEWQIILDCVAAFARYTSHNKAKRILDGIFPWSIDEESPIIIGDLSAFVGLISNAVSVAMENPRLALFMTRYGLVPSPLSAAHALATFLPVVNRVMPGLDENSGLLRQAAPPSLFLAYLEGCHNLVSRQPVSSVNATTTDWPSYWRLVLFCVSGCSGYASITIRKRSLLCLDTALSVCDLDTRWKNIRQLLMSPALAGPSSDDLKGHIISRHLKPLILSNDESSDKLEERITSLIPTLFFVPDSISSIANNNEDDSSVKNYHFCAAILNLCTVIKTKMPSFYAGKLFPQYLIPFQTFLHDKIKDEGAKKQVSLPQGVDLLSFLVDNLVSTT